MKDTETRVLSQTWKRRQFFSANNEQRCLGHIKQHPKSFQSSFSSQVDHVASLQSKVDIIWKALPKLAKLVCKVPARILSTSSSGIPHECSSFGQAPLGMLPLHAAAGIWGHASKPTKPKSCAHPRASRRSAAPSPWLWKHLQGV